MKNIRPLFIVGIVVISGIGANALSHGQSKETLTSSIGDEYDMVIIAPELFADALQPLIEHKNSVGIETTLKTVESIYDEYEGRDTAEQIKYFIKDAIETYGISYVLLVGGKGIFPIRETKAYSEALAHSFIYHTDLYYADIYDAQGRFCSWNANNNTIFGEMNETENKDGIDGFPDVCVGRFLSRSVSDLGVVVQKSITYETQTFGSPWFHHAIAIGGDSHVYPFDEFVEPLVLGIKGRMAFEGDFMGDTAQDYLDDFEFVKLYGNFLRRDAEKISKESISTAINNGAGFLVINTHGLTDKIFTHPPLCPKRWIPTPDGYTINDVKELTNGNKLPIGVFCCCLTGYMDTISYPFAWEFIQNDQGGGVACFALSESGQLAFGTLSTKVLTGHLSIGVIKAYSQGNDIIGDIWKDTIENYLNDEFAMSYGDGTLSENLVSFLGIIVNYETIQNWILFGDPSLKIGGYPGV